MNTQNNQPNNPQDEVIRAIKQTLDLAPHNAALWLHYADLLAAAGRREEAIAALRVALEVTDDKTNVLRKLIPLLRINGQVAEALIRVEKLLAENDDAALRREYAKALKARGDNAAAWQQYQRALQSEPQGVDDELETLRENQNPAAEKPADEDNTFDLKSLRALEEENNDGEPALAEIAPTSAPLDDLAGTLDWGDFQVSFKDVAGLEAVKNQIRLRIIAPFQNPEIYQAFRRSGGGGILMYGPPGCGKTFIARATAGECGARFLSIGIHEIIDKYWGESEKMMHALFEEARHRAPTVLFFDEFDALGSSRGRTESQFWKTLVDQLLQEMDGMGGKNDDVLVFAATNLPWNVDSAFRRPGRFDRVLFVPPPDEAARVEILRRHSSKLPGGDGIDVNKLARQTALMTGADLKSLCERASERALERSLSTGKIHPVSMSDFERELKQMQTSASEWLATARNYARYSNESGQYDELTEFLKQAKRW
jgi:transitional endoplasmic reticulum ATPase